MDLKNFFKQIIRPVSITPPSACQNAFLKKFKDAINVEWSEKGDLYEAVFYRHNLEHLANFTNVGTLIDYRMSLPAELIPVSVKSHLEEKGEIMNCILINRGNSLVYEAIVRDKNLNRYQVEMSELAKETALKQL